MDLEEWEFIAGEAILSMGEVEKEERTIIRYENWSDLDINYFHPPMPLQELTLQNTKDTKTESDLQEPKTQVFFKNTKDSEFADITMIETPRSPTTAKGFVPASAAFDFDDDENDDNIVAKNMVNLLKLGLTGIGAVCSFIIFLGTQNRQNLHPNIAFQIHNDRQQKKRNVMKWNDAVRGAQVTYGGNYEGSLN